MSVNCLVSGPAAGFDAVGVEPGLCCYHQELSSCASGLDEDTVGHMELDPVQAGPGFEEPLVPSAEPAAAISVRE